MCQDLCTVPIKFTLNGFNGLHSIVGLTLLIYGIVCQVKSASTFSEFTMGIAVFVLLTGIMGLIATSQRSHCLLTTYSIFMSLLLLANIIILIIAFSTFKTLIGSVNTSSSSAENAKQWLQNHKDIYIYVQLSLVAIEFICVSLGLMYRASEHIKDANSDINYDRFGTSDLTLDVNATDNYGTNKDATTMSDAAKRREALKAKYRADPNNSVTKQNSLRQQNNSISK